jgi:squalene-associated FAD-dependent desaturase
MESGDRVNDRDVIVVGAGVAGLSAASALAKDGAKVTVLERRPYVGGRAYSYPHPALEEVVDSQHVLLGCCTNLIEFCDQAGLADKIRWYDEQIFLEPGGRSSTIKAGGLPAPLHYAGSFLKAEMLGVRDKLAIARGLTEFSHGYPAIDTENAAQWYRRTRQTPVAIRHFWEPILLATLNDSAENCSMKYAGKVFYELFLKSSTGGRLGIPTVPLSDFYSAGSEMVERDGGTVQLRSSVEEIQQLADGRWAVKTAEETYVARDLILALPFEQTQRLIATMTPQTMTLQDAEGSQVKAALVEKMAAFIHSPFISILLWYDRQITTLDHAWLLDTTIQWFFHKSRIRGYEPELGSYVELVIAGSKRELPMTRAEILEPALAELARFFPEAGKARLLKSGILKEARATFSVTAGLDASRPHQKTDLKGLYLAGDWTATEWPSTMEGAARSGRLAAGALVGKPHRFMAAELTASGIMRLIGQ